MVRLLDYEDHKDFYLNQPYKGNGTSSGEIRLSILGLVVFVVIVVLLVKLYLWWTRKGARKFNSTTNMGTMWMQAVVKGPKVRISCNSCGKVFPNWAQNKYKLSDEPNGRYTIKSMCCDSECRVVASWIWLNLRLE